MKSSSIMLAGLLVCSTAAVANPTECVYGEISRTIEVVYSDPGQPLPCEVIYSKSEQSSIEVLWRADNEADYCEVKASQLIEKLTGFGWTCDTTPAEVP
jgi:hypothetical protein